MIGRAAAGPIRAPLRFVVMGFELAIDETHVYFATGSAIKKVPK